jgi:hypothetical protein
MLSSPVGLLLMVRRLSYHHLPLCGLRPLASCWLSSNGAERWRFVALSVLFFSGALLGGGWRLEAERLIVAGGWWLVALWLVAGECGVAGGWWLGVLAVSSRISRSFVVHSVCQGHKENTL